MKFPKEFYYTLKNEGAVYSYDPEGQIDVNELVKAKPYWKKNTSGEQIEKKILIIAAWNTTHWLFKQKDRVNKLLNELIDEGFSIYLWNRKELVPLAKNSVFDVPFLVLNEENVLVFPEEINAVVQQSTFREQPVHVLDDYWLQFVLHDEDTPFAYSQRVSEFNMSSYQEKTLRIIQAAKLPPDLIVNNEFSESAHLVFSGLCMVFPTAEVSNYYEYLNLKQEWEESLLNTGRITDHEAIFTLDDLRHIQRLKVHFNLPARRLQTLLGYIENLAFLDLAHCTSLTEDFTQGLNLSSMDTLSLAGATITTSVLVQLLAKTPNLRFLNLINCRDLHGDFPDLDLSELEFLFVSNSSLSSQNLNKLLQTTTKIKIIRLGYCVNIQEDFTQGVDLSSLLLFNAANSALPGAVFGELALKANKMKHLSLFGIKNLLDHLPQDFNLEFLEAADLGNADISLANIKKLVAKTRRLNSLNFAYKQLDEHFVVDLDLSSLESLYLAQALISNFLFEKLLCKMRRLKVLSVSDYGIFPEQFTALRNLPTLERFSVSGPYSGQNLRRLLSIMPRLKILDLSGIQGPLDDFSDNLDFSSLEELYLGAYSVCNSSVKKLLLKATSLQVLTLEKCQQIPKDLLSGLNLSVLEKLIIRQCSIHPIVLANLCRSLPGLRELDIDARSLSLVNIPNFAALMPNVLVRGVLRHWKTPFSVPIHHAIPVHNPRGARNNKPPAADFQFHFKGKNKSVHQNMIIEKLSQYWSLTNQHKAIIPQIQNGICNALSHLLLDYPLDQWFVTLADWDGSEEHLYQQQEVLVPIFKVLTEYVYQYQVKLTNHGELTYLGDNLAEFLTTQPSSMIFHNPWHSIAVRYSSSTQQWVFYDPNCEKGIIACSKEQLIPLIHRSVGRLISVLGNYVLPTPSIRDPSAFIREGGFLLWRGTEDYQYSLLAQLPVPADIAIDALQGLLLRTNRGVPAWVFAMNEPLSAAYTFELLSRFMDAYPQDYQRLLVQSISDLPVTERTKYLRCLQNLPTATEHLVRLISHVFTSLDFEKALQTWQKQKPTATSVALYVHQLVQHGPKKQLLELESMDGVQAMQLLIEKYGRSASRPMFYIDSPDDLVCSAPFMSNEQGLGVVHPGPGGRFYDFLMRHQCSNPAPLILINYDNFAADDVVRFNQLLDDQPRADGTPLPQATQIIGLINPKKSTVYQGADFYSRFDKVTTSLFSEAQLMQEIAPLPIYSAEGALTVTVINLYQAVDWKERLLGKWVIQEDKFIFVEGALITALSTGLALAIHNGLWDNAEFIQFWRHACLRGYIDYAGGRLFIPDSLQLVKYEGYDWATLASHVSFVAQSTAIVAMNPGRLSTFFQEYACDNSEKTLKTLPGLIARNANKSIQVQITRSIDVHQWAMVLDVCRQYNVHLYCACAPAVSVPTALQHLVPAPIEWDSSINHAATLLVESSDPDASIALLTKTEHDWQIVEVSECLGSDLLMQLHATQNKQNLRYEFNQTTSALLTALAKKQKVILKGYFSAELADALAPLLLQRKTTIPNAGTLILVSENMAYFDYLPRKKHQVNAQHKREILTASYTLDELKVLDAFLWETEGLSQLKARLTYKRINPHVTDTTEAWQGLYRLPGTIHCADFNAEHSAELAKAFNQQRLEQVNRVLAYSSYVFLTGLTGVGKSTFVAKNFDETTSTLYQGEEKLLDWVLDNSAKRKILFIDEANLSPRQWSEFEGLFNDPPGILINGGYYPLSANHKVVFAGNPVNYGDERKLAAFFARHGQALIFAPMPLEFIYEEILKPVLAHSVFVADALMICQPALAVYRFIGERSDEQLLISPRELQMMVLQVLTYMAQQQPTLAEAYLAAQHYAYQFAKDLVPQCYRTEFARCFKPEIALPRKTDLPAAGEHCKYLNTPSRAALTQQLYDLLALSQFKKMQASNEAQRYGGLGGMVIEGEAGIGKSELVSAVLAANGYEEVHEYRYYPGKNIPTKPFYRMPVSMQTADKKRLLLTAFHEGAVVIIDEINSAPMMERFLNDLLMGKTAEGERPRTPGFVVIGTQNPVTLAGRRAPSTALARRLSTVYLPAYTHQEMRDILIAKGVESEHADLLLGSYEHNVSKARQERLTPEPSFRDLLRLAKQVIRHPDFSLTQLIGSKRQRMLAKEADMLPKRVRVSDEEVRTEKNTQQVSSARASFFATQPAAKRRNILSADSLAGTRFT